MKIGKQVKEIEVVPIEEPVGPEPVRDPGPREPAPEHVVPEPDKEPVGV